MITSSNTKGASNWTPNSERWRSIAAGRGPDSRKGDYSSEIIAIPAEEGQRQQFCDRFYEKSEASDAVVEKRTRSCALHHSSRSRQVWRYYPRTRLHRNRAKPHPAIGFPPGRARSPCNPRRRAVLAAAELVPGGANCQLLRLRMLPLRRPMLALRDRLPPARFLLREAAPTRIGPTFPPRCRTRPSVCRFA